MKLKNIIEKSYYASVGYIENIDSIHRLEKYILYNLKILK